jgi:hypothetical protein
MSVNKRATEAAEDTEDVEALENISLEDLEVNYPNNRNEYNVQRNPENILNRREELRFDSHHYLPRHTIESPYNPTLTNLRGFDVEKLNASNYKLWITDMEIILKTYNLWNAVIGEKKFLNDSREREYTDEELFATYRAIYQNCDIERRTMIAETRNPREAWLKLENTFTPRNFIGKIQSVMDLFSIKMKNDENMIKYIDRVMETYKIFLHAGNEKVSDCLIAQLMIIGLTSDYSMVKTIVNTFKESEQTTQRIKEVLIAEYNSKKLEKESSKKNEEIEAMHVRKIYYNSKESTGENKRCYKCGKIGHFIKDCKSNSKEQHPKNKDHRYKDRGNRKFAATISLGNVYVTKTGDKWILDTGATHHITYEKSDFSALENTTESVNWGNGSVCEVAGRGRIELCFEFGEETFEITLNNVLWIPRFKHKIFSIGAASCKGWKFAVGTNNITGIYNRIPIFTGKRTLENLFTAELIVVKDEENDIRMENMCQEKEIDYKTSLLEKHVDTKSKEVISHCAMENRKIPESIENDYETSQDEIDKSTLQK